MMAVKIIKEPKALTAPPNNKIRIPNPPKMIVKRINCFFETTFSLISMNCDTKTELKKIATNNEEPNTTDNVIGK